MQAGTALVGRRILATSVAISMVASVMFLLAGPAEANHIPATGPVPDNCVNFQAGNTGTLSPPDFPSVDITLDSWEDSASDPHTVNFTISALAGNQWVDISVKSGTDETETGPYLNGSHTYESGLQQAISHIRLCVFEGDPTTTTTVEDTTTTTVEDTTTTTVEDTTTTTVEDTTTTTVPETTTTTDEVLPTVITTSTTSTTLAPTTTVEDEVLDTEVLPFTGGDNDMLALLAGGLGLLGTLVLVSTRRIEEN